MLEIYNKEFECIMSETKGEKRTLLLANLMSQMEQFYKLSMIKEIFERETDVAVQELYLKISNARKL